MAFEQTTNTPRAHPRVPSTVDVSVLIPVLNEGAQIRASAAGMCAQRFPGTVEFLFVDGNSDDDTRAILEELATHEPSVRVLPNPDRQTATGLNVGLRHARGEFVARMDAHAHYPPDYLARGVERLGRGDVDWVTGPMVPVGGGKWSHRVALALDSGLGTVGSRKWGSASSESGGHTAEVELDTGVWLGVWRRSTLDRLGGWDAGWPVNQDSELAARMLDEGGRIVMIPDMAATYMPRSDLRSLARQYRRYGFYRAKTACRHPRSARRSHVLAPGVALALPIAALAPRALARPARKALAAYALSLCAGALRTGIRTRDAQAAAIPLVSAVMHLSWGYGYLWGSLRHGPPTGAVRHVLGRRPDVARPRADAPRPVDGGATG